MKLIGSLTSPYVRKVRIVLNEKKIDHDFIIDVPWESDSKVSELNPLGKVPVLVTDDGMTLFDSAVIVDFLEWATPNNRLIPQPNRIRALVRCAEALAGGMCDAGAAIMIEKRMHKPEQVSGQWVGRNLAKIRLGVEKMSKDLGNANFFIEDTYGLADIAAGCALSFIDRLIDSHVIDFSWREEHPNLAAYFEKLGKRASFIDTAPPAQ